VLAPENTLVAFQNALDFGADVIETDVQLTKDGALVNFHDEKVDRVTNGVGKLADFTLAELKQFDAGYKFTHDNGTTFPFRGKGIKIPTPVEVFTALPHAYFNIEIKDNDPRAAEQLYKAIVDMGMQHNVVVGGRWCESLRHFRKLSIKDKIHTSACEGEVVPFMVHSVLGTSSIWYSLFYPMVAKSLQIPTSSGPFALDSTSMFASLKWIGKHVHFWVINDPNEIRRLIQLGANGIITDRPDIAVKVFEELGIKEKVEREIYKYQNIRFYVPVDNHVEVHTCVGLMCAILHNLNKYFHIIISVLILVVFGYALKKYFVVGTHKRKKE
jgi:glycerophosphoryl diester phosphodiesterase